MESLMSRINASLIAAAVIGQFVGLLAWIDPLLFPLILLGPVVTGAVAAARRMSYAWIAILWVSAGVNMLVTDGIINNEDYAFHAGVTVLMVLLAGLGFGVVKLAIRNRQPA
jgi:hypothetical protein